MTPRVLVVDDEPAILDSVTYALEREGFEIRTAADGEEAIEVAREGGFDAVILDVMLPRLSGTEVCRRLRAESGVPILMLTARDSELDRVVGLELGADDYVTKPFSLAELVSRVRALLRRRDLDRAEARAPIVRAGGLELDLARHEAHADGRQLSLTPSEFMLLELLAREPGRVFSRRELVRQLWQSDFVGSGRSVDTHVVNLRRKIEREPGRPTRLLTVRGAGYKLAAV
jgi:two-component system, OmpR family, response regulator RegX3